MIEAVTVILICALILVLAWVCSRVLGKTMSRRQRGKYMEVIDQTALGSDRALLIVRVQKRYLLLGSANGQISMLTELDEDFDKLSESSGEGDDPSDGSVNFKDAFLYNLKKYTGVSGGKKEH